MKHFLEKDNITILVTDSGIGGISVAHLLYKYLLSNFYYNKVNIVYADSRENKHGYNSFEKEEDKINVFSKRLSYLQKEINPDIIFIACNTLSVLIDKTDFYKHCSIPIITILESSLNSMMKVLNENKLLFILGTKTTIESNYYKNTLISYGYDKNLIVNQLCPNLAKYIEESHETNYFINSNIEWLTNRIIEKKNNNQIRKFSVSFNCTHYYYVIPTFRKYFEKLGYKHIEYICPNENMIESFCDLINIERFINNNVNLMFSDLKLSSIQKNKINRYLKFKI